MKRNKVIFLLRRDTEGYPPVDAEGLWVELLDGNTARIDNVPFFVNSATLGDTISYDIEDGELRYVSTLRRSENSLIRVACYPMANPAQIRARIESFGCETEFDAIHSLIAVNIPPEGDLKGLQAFLQAKEAAGELGYEEPILVEQSS